MSVERLVVINDILGKTMADLDRLSEKKSGTFSGIVLGNMARKIRAYVQDAQSNLAQMIEEGGGSVNGSVDSTSMAPATTSVVKMKASPAAVPGTGSNPASVAKPPLLLVMFQQGEGECPVCSRMRELGLFAVARNEGGESTMKLIVCRDCLIQPAEEASPRVKVMIPPGEIVTEASSGGMAPHQKEG